MSEWDDAMDGWNEDDSAEEQAEGADADDAPYGHDLDGFEYPEFDG
jgi:hypothetical protein